MLKSGVGEPILSTSPRDPIYKLIEAGKEQFPDLLKMNHVEGGRLKAETPDGTFELQVVALPPEEGLTAFEKFWEKVVRVRGGDVDEKPTPTPVSISPRVSLDEFKPGFHTQLMGNVPYAVMADGTRYAINVSAPIKLKTGEWEEFDEEEVSVYSMKTGRRKIGRRRKGLALVVRADNKPLIQKKLGTVTFDTFQEVLLGFHDQNGVNQASITDKVTIQDSPRISLGESAETTSIKQHLEFHSLDTASAGTPSDKLGLIDVVVYYTISEEVSEIIEAPIPSIIETTQRFSLGAVTRGGGGFSGGETAFGRERRQQVNMKGVRIEKPLATFQLALVGEIPDHGMEMTPQIEG